MKLNTLSNVQLLVLSVLKPALKKAINAELDARRLRLAA